MLVSGGKVVAIDKVKHDGTLSGDGRFDAIGVRTDVILSKADAEATYQHKGDYVCNCDMTAYCKQSYADATFAKIADVYSKTDADSRFQPVGNYATTTELNDARTWVNDTFMTTTVIENRYATKIYADNAAKNTYTTIHAEIDPHIAACQAHANNATIHVSTEDREFLTKLSAIDFSALVSVSALSGFATPEMTYGIKYDNTTKTWEFAEITGGGGGGALPVYVDPGHGLTARREGLNTYFGVSGWDEITSAVSLVNASAESVWNTVVDKQDKLSEEQLDALDSLTGAYTLVGDESTGIVVTEDPVEKTTTISYTGRQGNVELVEGEPAEPDEQKIYLVVSGG